MVTIQTDLDLSQLAKSYGTLISAATMKDIGMKYRVYRHNVIMSRRQLHDLSPMPPLKPETIARKSGLAVSFKTKSGQAVTFEARRRKKKGLIGFQNLKGKWGNRYGYYYEDEDEGSGKRKRFKIGRVAKHGGVNYMSLTPDIPLSDTGNMVAANSLNIQTAPGLLLLSQGKTREKIAQYHQSGGGNLPQRVHLSWNKEFVETIAMPLIEAYYTTAIQKARVRRVA